MSARVSVITPSHQGQPWLRLCANSVADQGLVLREHIIQDTGAAGDMRPELRPHTRLRLFQEPDQGMYAAINKGLARAEGEIWAWLNSDEQYLPGVLVRVAEYFQAHPEVDILIGDAIVIDEQGHALCYRKAMLPPRGLIPYITLPWLSCAVFFRRRVVELGYRLPPEYRVIGDSVLFHALRTPAIRWALLAEFCAVFTYRVGNLGGSRRNQEEFRRWRAQLGAGFPILGRGLGRLWVNSQRWLQGATRPLALDYAIHTLDSPDQRQRFRARRVTGRWSTRPAV